MTAGDRRLVHMHLSKTAGKSLFTAMQSHLGPLAKNFSPLQQEEFLKALEHQEWRVVSGHFSAANSAVRKQLHGQEMFTILRDPIERFYSAYNFIRKTPGAANHRLFMTMTPIEAAWHCLEQKLDYGRNSQCSGVIWDAREPEKTAATALRQIERRYAFVATLEQMPRVGEFLAEVGLIADKAAISHANRTQALDPGLRNVLADILGDSTAEDNKLHKHVLHNGPLLPHRRSALHD